MTKILVDFPPLVMMMGMPRIDSVVFVVTVVVAVDVAAGDDVDIVVDVVVEDDVDVTADCADGAADNIDNVVDVDNDNIDVVQSSASHMDMGLFIKMFLLEDSVTVSWNLG